MDISNNVNLAFLGDISLNGNYKEFSSKSENPFIGVKHLLENADVVIGNLEAVCVHKDGKHHPKQTRLSIDPASLPLLAHLNLHLVTLANNHIFDNLEDGLRSTLHFLDTNGIKYTGASLQSKSHLPFVLQKNGFKIAFLNFVHSATHPGIDESHPIAVNHYKIDEIKETIKLYRSRCDLVVLILHWGMDNSRFPEPWQRKHAREFVRSGADLIVGHHSHVLQGYEKINNSFVFYSLGNFAFAPLKDGTEYQLDPFRQNDSIILFAAINKNNIAVNWQPIVLDGLHVKLSARTKLKKLSAFIPLVSNPFIWPVYDFYLNKVYKIFYYFFGSGRNPLRQLKKIDHNRLLRAGKILGFK